jgi:hypothetical protein
MNIGEDERKRLKPEVKYGIYNLTIDKIRTYVVKVELTNESDINVGE